MDLLYSTSVKLLAYDFLSLTQRPSDPHSFFLNGRPVSRAETLGVVVSREQKQKFLKFIIDDGSGCIPCILWLNHFDAAYFSKHNPLDVSLLAQMAADQASEIRLGALARVRGRITAYRGTLQITVSSAIVEKDPNAEILHWLDCVRLARDCYNAARRSLT